MEKAEKYKTLEEFEKIHGEAFVHLFEKLDELLKQKNRDELL